MKKIGLFIGLVILVGFVIYNYSCHIKQEDADATNISIPASSPQTKVAVEPEPLPDELAEEYTPDQIEYMRETHKAALAANQNIIFYGKCVDQYGAPISGVKIRAKISKIKDSLVDSLKGEGMKYYDTVEIYTDDKGRFQYFDKGSYFLVESMTKDGHADSFRGAKKGYRFGQFLYGSNMAGMHSPDILSPVVFSMWRYEENAEVVIRSAQLKLKTNDSVEAAYIDLLSGNVASSNTSASTIKISGKSSGDRYFDDKTKRWVVASSNKYEWSYTFQFIEGGILQTEDLFLFKPPLDGYSKTVSKSISSQQESWTSQHDGLKFYFKSRAGVYGSFIVDVASNTQGDIWFNFSRIVHNPTGDPNLEHFE
jgi:hypothetical protein